jgi:hypothetical protein
MAMAPPNDLAAFSMSPRRLALNAKFAWLLRVSRIASARPAGGAGGRRQAGCRGWPVSRPVSAWRRTMVPRTRSSAPSRSGPYNIVAIDQSSTIDLRIGFTGPFSYSQQPSDLVDFSRLLRTPYAEAIAESLSQEGVQ